MKQVTAQDAQNSRAVEEVVARRMHGQYSFSREQIDTLLYEIGRLKEGRFTEAEFQGLCHNFDACDAARFREGCKEYQEKLFGAAQAAIPNIQPYSPGEYACRPVYTHIGERIGNINDTRWPIQAACGAVPTEAITVKDRDKLREVSCPQCLQLLKKTEPCCECGEDYPRIDLVWDGEIYCPKCREVEKGRAV